MKTRLCSLFVLLPLALSFSQTNAYEKCVEECIRAGGSEAGCRTEACDIRDTAIIIIPNRGNPLLLPSYELRGPAPVIDGSLMSRDGDPSTDEAKDEWKEACSRTLVMSDSTTAQIFLANNRDTLYLGLTYRHGNNGDGCGARLLFDEGNNTLPSQYDGKTDLRLSAPGGMCNEQACGVYKMGGGVTLMDGCWNGTAWAADGDSAIDFKAAKAYYSSENKVHHNEFAIPLNNGKSDGSANSDLNVSYNDILGFYLEVIKMGTGAGTFHWIETNGRPTRPDTFPNWARIQLSVKREFFTFHTGNTPTPPVLDGSINEACWNGAYQRELVLSNFHYGYYLSKIWCLEDSAEEFIYVGLRVFDKAHHAQDYCQLFFEETGENATDSIRDYDLDNNAENSLKVTNGNEFTDIHWRLDQGGWNTDNESADAQAAQVHQADSFVDYEFKVLRSAGAQDIDIPKNGMLGFHFRYHDADKTVEDLSNYYWEYTTNNDAQILDEQGSLTGNPLVYIATGWTNLQLGGPYIEVIKPKTSDELTGVVEVEIYSGTDSLKSVVVFIASDTTKKVNLTYQGNGTWTGTIDLTGVSGSLTLIIRAETANGLIVERMINKAEIPVISDGPDQKFRGPLALGRVVQSSSQGVQLLVRMVKPGDLTLEVYSVSGKKIMSKRIPNMAQGQHWIDLTGGNHYLGNGTYVLKLGSGTERVTEKFAVFK
ncbi:MAG: T9SS type A sorting domain-containing protein [Chitinispirillaceae bacterium]|nr:T9SS type A sorting domain-containing protein [Chitinispirillaceae bacterium]